MNRPGQARTGLARLVRPAENNRPFLRLKAGLVRQVPLRAQLRQGRQAVFRPEALDNRENFAVEKVVGGRVVYPLVIHHDIAEVDLLALPAAAGRSVQR